MYRSTSKRAQLVKRITVYSLMTAGVLLVVTLLAFIMLGYRFNRDTSSIQQGGLVQFASRPTDALVKIGNATLSAATPSKITVNPGKYDVTMNRQGYKEWSKNIDVDAGEVLWLNYAQLTPNDIKTEQQTKFENVTDVKTSPNGDRFAAIEDNKKPEVTFLDVTGDQPKSTTITLPSSVLRKDTEPVFSLDDWANDSDRLLLNVQYGGERERLVVDRRDAEDTYNISTEYQQDLVDVEFDPRSSERLYVRSGNGEVRSINRSSDSLSGVIASSVSSMSFYGNDALFFVQRLTDAEQTVSYVSLGSDDVKELRKVSSDQEVRVAAAQYFSEPHIVISNGSSIEVFKARSLPSSDSTASISLTSMYVGTLPSNVDYLSIRAGGRFVVAQYANGVGTYDLELEKQTLTTLDAPLNGELRWLDRYHYYVTNGKNLVVMEFDGGNPQTITGLTTTFDATQSDNGEFIFSVNRNDDGFFVQRSRMILEN